METKEIKTQQPQPKKTEWAKRAATHAAAMAAGGVAGAAGVGVFDNDEEMPIVDPVEPTPDPVEPIPDPVEPTPDPVEPTPGQEEPTHPHGGDTPVEPQPSNEVETVDPTDIAQAIVSGEEIDPNDIDTVAVVNFDEIGTVYDVDGNTYTAATFHDYNGSEYVMVDIDNDSIFDEIYDDDGNYVAEAHGLTVSDAQTDINAEGYLAQNEIEVNHFDETNGDDYLDDTITT
jgi:hypothetical protein